MTLKTMNAAGCEGNQNLCPFFLLRNHDKWTFYAWTNGEPFKSPEEQKNEHKSGLGGLQKIQQSRLEQKATETLLKFLARDFSWTSRWRETTLLLPTQ